MKVLAAWYAVSLTWTSRTAYAMLSDMAKERAFVGTNIFRTMLDGLIFVLVGILLAVLPLVGLLLTPVYAIHLYWGKGAEDRAKLSELLKDRRVRWRTGTIADPEPAEEEPKDG